MKISGGVDANNIPYLLSPIQNNTTKIFNKYNTMVLTKKKNCFDISNNLSGEARQNELGISKKLNKKILFLKKIDPQEPPNKLYLEGIEKIFNDEKIFFNKFFKNLKVVVGKSHSKSEINISNKNDKKNNFLRKQSYFHRLKERNLSFATYRTDSMKNNSRSRKNTRKKDNTIDDEDLKNIYKKYLDREKNKKKINLKFNKSKNNNFMKKEFDGILNLQNLILRKRKKINKETEKIEKKIMGHTSKNRDDLLINQINDYRIKKEEINEIEKANEEKNMININNKTNQNNLSKTRNIKLKGLYKNVLWLTSLRDYKNNIVTKKSNNFIKRCNSTNKLNIKNKTSTFLSFDKRDAIYNLNDNINNIYPRIIPLSNKDNENIRDTLSEFNFFSRNKNREKNKFKKTHIKLFSGLNVQGKKLIDFEMELSKDLEGKKKRLVQFPYLDGELKSKTFFQSDYNNNLDVPQTVKNSIELHYN